MVAGKAVDQGEEARLDVVHESGLLAPLAAKPEKQAEPLGHSLAIALHVARLHELAEAAPDRIRRVRRLDKCELPDDGRRRCERGRVAVAAAMPAQDAHGRAHPCRQLLGQARFADARLADDRDQHWLAGRAGQAEALAEDGLFADPVDEGDRAAGRAGGQALHGVGLDRFIEALCSHPLPPPERDFVDCQRVRGRARQHLPGKGCRLQSGGGVHYRAGDQQLARRTDAGRRFA